MTIATRTAIAVLTALALIASPAAAADPDFDNSGFIGQVANIQGGIEMTQELTNGSVQGINVNRSKGRFTNRGRIEQEVNAREVKMTQRLTNGSTMCLNCNVAG